MSEMAIFNDNYAPFPILRFADNPTVTDQLYAFYDTDEQRTPR
jgi:hypothetical protein